MTATSRLTAFFRKDPKLARLLAIAFAVKLSTLIVIYLAFKLLPFCEPCYHANFTHPAGEPIGIASAFKTWDGHHYLNLAESWYSPNQTSNAFYPLYPLLVRITRPAFFGNTLLAGLALSHAFFFAFLCFFYLLSKDMLGELPAYRAGLLCLAFPTSFYAGLVYSEALFMLLAILSLWALRKGSGVLGGIAGFLLPLSRPQGILMAVPALWQLVAGTRRNNASQVRTALLTLLLIPIGFAAYLLIMRSATGDYFAGFTSQKAFVAQNAVANLFHPWQWFHANFLGVRLAVHGFTNSAIDRVFFLLYLAALVPVYRRLDKVVFVYALVMGLSGALAGSFMAYTRYLLPIFPIFMALAASLGSKYFLVLVPAAFLQVLFLVAHCLNYWIA